MKALVLLVTVLLTGCASVGNGPAMAPGAKYVSMGSSYAAGSGIGLLVADTPARCGRTTNNYPRLLAQRLGLQLIDVSCGGATTNNILRPWAELPPQIEAVSGDTRLVTVTIGGNDVGYVKGLAQGLCGRSEPAATKKCPLPVPPSDAEWQALEENMRAIAREVRRRAPQARLFFIDYLRILPQSGSCPGVALNLEAMAQSRATFDRLAAVTASVARSEHADLVTAGALSVGHDGCSAQPWAMGYPATASPFHPTAMGHEAIALRLAETLAAPK